jgi:ribosomal protein L37AE/L43A
MGNEEVFGMFGWSKMLWKEECEHQKRCPNCKSRRIHYDEDRNVWFCLDCENEWGDDEF